MIAPYLVSSLVNLFQPEKQSHFRLIKDPNLAELNDFLIHEKIPITLYSKMLTF